MRRVYIVLTLIFVLTLLLPGAGSLGTRVGAAEPPIGEVTSLRTMVSKTFYLGNGNYALSSSEGPIHYYGSNGSLQNINNQIVPAVAPWNYQMTQDAYTARFLSNFASGQVLRWDAFNQSITFQPMELQWTNDLNQVSSISMPQNTAVLITNTPQQVMGIDTGYQSGTIRWDNAYGEGRNFWWTCDAGRLAKVLELETNLPTPPAFITNGGNPVARLNFIFAPSSGLSIYVNGALWDKSIRTTTTSSIEFRNASNQTIWHFEPQRVWDSAGNETVATGELRRSGQNLYISIRVPYTWLQTAVYPVSIDPSFETFSTSYDGWVYKENSVDYWTTWVAATGQGVGAATNVAKFGQVFSTYCRIQRAYFPFDTSGIPDTAALTSAYIKLYGETDSTTVDFNMTIQRGSSSRPDPENNGLATSDYDQSLYSDNLGYTTTSGFNTTGYNTINYHAADLGYINKTGLTRIVMRSDREIDGYEPSASPEYVVVYSEGETGTGKDPYIHVGYTDIPAAPTNVAATDGTYTTKVTVNWTKSTEATGYYIFEGSNLLATLGDVSTYDDSAAPAPTITPENATASDGTSTTNVTLSVNESTSNGTSRTYKVKAFNVAGNSTDSSTDTGYRGTTSLTYQWYRSAADSNANYSVIVGGTSDPYSDTGGVTTPDGRYYLCCINMTGAISQNTTPDRGYMGSTCSPGISLDISSWSVNGGSPVAPGVTYNTTLTYFNVTNSASGGAIDITIHGQDMTGGGYTWTLNDTGTPGNMVYGMYAGLSGVSFNIIVKKNTTYNYLVQGLANNASQIFGLKIYIPTGLTAGDNSAKSGSITLTAVCS